MNRRPIIRFQRLTHEKAGFRHFLTLTIPGERAPSHLMRLERDVLLALSPDGVR